MDSPSPFEVPWGGNFDIILSSRTVQVHLKFHGGGNFDIILSSQTVQVNLKFSQFEVPWDWDFYISYPCGQFEIPWGWER